MAEWSWAALDLRAREVKRSAFAETRRGVKMARERVANACTAAKNLTAKQFRRLRSVPARTQHEIRRWDDTRLKFDTYRAEWTVEREIARVVRGSGPIIVGPWLSEVGYEALDRIPFVRWIKATYHIDAERLVVVTRGGASAWYRDITEHAVEVFDLMPAEQFLERNARRAAEGGGTVKQHSQSSMDAEIVAEVVRRRSLSSARVLHPSVMYRLFKQFWLGHRPLSFLERRTRYRLLGAPDVALPTLPRDYVAVKFYTATSLPPTPTNLRLLQSIVLRLAETTDVVMLDTGLVLDDHEDYSFEAASRVHSVRTALRATDNLAVQTAVIARAKSFVGTCGSVAWLAPLLGVDTTAIYSDARFLHGHLQAARRVYQVAGAARFAPFDLSVLDPLGRSWDAELCERSDMSIRDILVTGGAGYIGSHLVDALVAREYRVTVLDNLEPQVHRSGTWPSYANPKATYVRGDVRDRVVFEPLVLASQAVVHFGAAVSIGQSMYQIDRYVDVNTRGTALLLDILVNNKHNVEKMIVASSIGVYGEGADTCATHGPVAPTIRPEAQLAARDWEQRCPVCREHVRSVPTPEDKALYRDNIYSMTKYHQEEMVLLIGKTYGIPAVAPRFFNVYGPRQSLSNPYAGVAAIWISRLLNGKQPVVFEDGGQLRDFVSIHDVVDCLILMLEKPGADFLPVNIGSGAIVSILDIARLLKTLLGSTIEPQVTQAGRTFDIRHNTADISRAQETVGYAPRVSLEDGFSELIEWAKTTPDVAVDFFDKALKELQDKGLLVKS